MRDWLCALDTLFCQRLLCCTNCGEAAAVMAMGIFELSRERCVAYTLCPRCQSKDGDDAVVRPVLERRYGGRVS